MKKIFTFVMALALSCSLTFAAAQSPTEAGTTRGQLIVLTIAQQNQAAFDTCIGEIVKELVKFNNQGAESHAEYCRSLQKNFLDTCKQYGANDAQAAELWSQVASTVNEALKKYEESKPQTAPETAPANTKAPTLENKGKELGTKCIETLMQGQDGEVVVAEIVKYAKSHCKSEAELTKFISGVADGIYSNCEKYEIDEEAGEMWMELITSQLYE